MNGSLGQIARSSMPGLKMNNFFTNQLIHYHNLSWSETKNEGSLLQHNYNKETLNFSLTKRIYY